MVVDAGFLSELAADPESDDFELLPESLEEPFELEELEELSAAEPDPFDADAGTVFDPLRLSVR